MKNFIIISIAIIVSILVDISESLPQQTLMIKYYNNTECSNITFKVDRYKEDCDLSYNYDECCNAILRIHELENGQKVNICYSKNNTSYLYDCVNKENYQHSSNWNIILVILIFVMSFIIVSFIVYLVNKRYNKKDRINNYDFNDYGTNYDV